LHTSLAAGEGNKTAEQRFRDAFERLKQGFPLVMPIGTPVTQNNIAKESGCDPSALRKARFPSLIAEVQHYVEHQVGERPSSIRQTTFKKRQKNRVMGDALQDFRLQRDSAQGLLADANMRIVELTEEVGELRRRLEELLPSAKTVPLKR